MVASSPDARPAGHRLASVWTPDIEARALQLFLVEGLSGSEVAAALGVGLTRSAVVAKIRRLGFRKRREGGPIVKTLSARRQARRQAGVGWRPSPAWPPIPLPPLRQVPATGRPATLASLADGACHWPIDDPGPDLMHAALFCAGPAGRDRYCPQHRALAARVLDGPPGS